MFISQGSLFLIDFSDFNEGLVNGLLMFLQAVLEFFSQRILIVDEHSLQCLALGDLVMDHFVETDVLCSEPFIEFLVFFGEVCNFGGQLLLSFLALH